MTSIAIAIAVASYGTGAKTPLDTILWRDMLPHLVKATLPEIRGGKYRYHVYIGYDNGDPVYDAPHAAALFGRAFRTMLAKVGVPNGSNSSFQLHMMAISDCRHAPSWVVSRLMQTAYDNGAQYMLQLNDDSMLLTEGWSHLLVTALRKYRQRVQTNLLGVPLFGVSGTGRLGHPSSHIRSPIAHTLRSMDTGFILNSATGSLIIGSLKFMARTPPQFFQA